MRHFDRATAGPQRRPHFDGNLTLATLVSSALTDQFAAATIAWKPTARKPMHADEAFLSEVLARPEEDEPRLIYADWLQSRNEVRASFIRRQCKLARLDVGTPERIALRLQTQRAASQFERKWTSRIRGMIRSAEFRRGFVERVTVDATTFLHKHQRLFQAAPIRSICFADAAGHLAEIVQCPGLQQIRELGFVGQSELTDLERVLGHPALRQVDSLRFGAGAFSLETLDAFSDLPRERTLKRLDIRQTLLSAPAIGELLGFPVCGQLEDLRIGPVPLLERRYQMALELSPILNRLRRLELSMCQLTASDLRELFHYCTSPTIADLRLPRNPLGWQGVQALLEAPFTDRLKTLDLSSCQLNAKALSVLARLPLRRLRRLNLNHNLLDHRGAKELAEAESLAAVVDLRVQGTQGRLRQGSFQLGDVGFSALVSNGLRGWRAIDVARNNLSVKSVRALLAADNLEQLSALDLSHNLLNDQAAAEMLRRGPWPNLVSIRLNNNAFSEKQRERLKAAFGTSCSL